MDIELVMKVAGVGMMVAIVCQILGKIGRDEHSMLVSVTGMIIVFIMLVDEVGRLFSSLRSLFGL